MAIAVNFELPEGSSLEQYDQLFRSNDQLSHQPDRRFHICYETATGFGVVDVWESEEAFAAFGEILGPLLAETDLKPTPHVHRIHQTLTAAGERGA
jgi:hypothetical protein